MSAERQLLWLMLMLKHWSLRLAFGPTVIVDAAAGAGAGAVVVVDHSF